VPSLQKMEGAVEYVRMNLARIESMSAGEIVEVARGSAGSDAVLLFVVPPALSV
jgi:hypothetical protein